MRFDVIVSGQYMENYGSHDWNGEGTCPSYWKFKGDHQEVSEKGVEMEDLASAMARAAGRLDELSWSNHGSSFSADTVMYIPADASHAVRNALRYDLDDRAARVYENATDADLAVLAAFRKFAGSVVATDPLPLPYEEYDVV